MVVAEIMAETANHPIRFTRRYVAAYFLAIKPHEVVYGRIRTAT